MKAKYIYQIFFVVSAVFTTGGVTSCTAGFEEANRPGNKVSEEELNRDSYGTGSFLINMQNQAFPEQENTYQMNQDLIGNSLGRYFTYANDGFKTKNFVLCNAPEGWVAYPLRDSKPKTESNFNNIKRVTNGDGVIYALALVLKAQSYLRLTDMYGPLIIGANSDDPNAYSSQEDVYKSILADLDQATSILLPVLTANPSAEAAAEYDRVYSGNLQNWLLFANSLKLRMAIRMRFVEPTLAQQIGEKAVSDGVITDNADNCAITYVPNGLYKTSIEWGDTRACADIETYMTGYQDPRLLKYFKATETAGDRDVIGCLAGADVANKNTAMKLYSAANVEQTTRGVWLTAAEMAFCRAEGALAGWQGMGGTVEELYNEAIRLSFEQWGATGADAYIQNSTAQPANYVDADGGYGNNQNAQSSITIKWDNSATADVMLERLIVQKWIALFPDGQEGWNEIRRTGYPKVFAPAQSIGAYNLKVANRIPFDPREITSNPDNYRKAVQLLGGADGYATKMWWQK